MSIFDDILAKADAVDKSVLEKYPQLKAAVDELDTIKPQLTELSTKFTDADTRLKGFETWAQTNWDYTQNKTKAQIAAEQQVAELRNAKDSDMTFEEILEGLKTQGIVTKTDIEPVVTEAVNKVTGGFAKAEQLNGLANGSMALYSEMTPLLFQHKDEFGEILKPNDLIKFMNDKRIDNFQLAYDQMVSPRRTEAQQKAAAEATAKHQEEIAAAEKRGEEKARQAVAMGVDGRIPTDLGGTPPVMGHLQRAFNERGQAAKGDEVKTDSSKLGDLVTAQMGVEDLLKERATRAVQ